MVGTATGMCNFNICTSVPANVCIFVYVSQHNPLINLYTCICSLSDIDKLHSLDMNGAEAHYLKSQMINITMLHVSYLQDIRW